MEENSATGNQVVKRGYLYIKRPPRKCWQKLKAWHKRYFVLIDSTRYSSPYLEMYEGKASEPRVVFDLDQCQYLGYSTQSSKFSYAVVLVCKEKSPLLLAAVDPSVTKSWLWALGLIAGRSGGLMGNPPDPPDRAEVWAQASVIHRVHDCRLPGSTDRDWDPALICQLGKPFQVTVQPTEDSQKWGLRGRLRLMVCRHGVGLARDGDTEYFLLWPVAYIRQFRHQSLTGGWWRSTLVTLEVGRRCSTGEGVYQFKSQNGAEIVEQLKKMMELWSSRKAIRRHSKPELESADRLNISDIGILPTRNSAPCTPCSYLSPTRRKISQPTPPSQHQLNYEIPVIACYPDVPQSKSSPTSGGLSARDFPLVDCARQNENEDEGYIEVLSGNFL